MHVIIKETTTEEKILTELLFVYNDSNPYSTHVGTIVESMNGLLKESGNNNTRIFSDYAGNIKFEDSFDGYKGIDVLIRFKNQKYNKTLRVADGGLWDMRDLLNEEATEEGVEYRILEVRGKLK